MSLFGNIRDRVVLGRKADEAFYELALNEFQSGRIRPGLMAKAMAECDGDEFKTKALYLKLLASAIRDDQYLAERAEQRAASEASRVAKDLARAEALDVARARSLARASRNKGCWSVFGYFCLGFAVLFVLLILFASNPDAPKSRNQGVGVSNGAAVPNVDSPPVAATNTSSEYDSLVSQFEAAFPQIDPNSSQYDESLMIQVAERIEQLVNGGYTAEYALQRAVAQVLTATPMKSGRAAENVASNAPPPSRSSEVRPKVVCEFKTVMTDDDYRACGRTPPSN